MANYTADAETREMGRKIVHHDAPGIMGWQTLCGHVDRTDYRWKKTREKVDCRACLAIVAHAAALKSTAAKKGGK